MKSKHLKNRTNEFLFLCVLLSVPLLTLLAVCSLYFGAVPCALTLPAALISAIYITHKPFPGPLTEKDSEESRRALFGRAKPIEELSESEKLLFDELMSQKKNVWKHSMPLFLFILILLIVSFFKVGLFPDVSITEKGLRVTPELLYLLKYAVLLAAPVMSFIATYYWNGLIISIIILCKWQTIYR